LLNILRSSWLYLNGFISVLIFGVIILFIGLFDKKKNITGIFVRIWGQWMCKSSGINISIEGLDFLTQKNQYIFIANHESLLDIPVVLSQIPFNIIFLTKKELFPIPLFGWAMHSAGMIRVDRQNKERAKKSVKHALTSLKDKNINVLVYPEGTRSSPEKLLPFKKGSFILAIQSGLPIVPITILNAGLNLPKRKLILNKQIDIKLIIHEPIETKNLNPEYDKDRLANLTYNIIKKDLK